MKINKDKPEPGLVGFLGELISRANTISQESTVRRFETTVGDLRQNRDTKVESDVNPWHPWAGHPGVYYFRKDDGVLYVGRAMDNTPLGNRVGTHIFRKPRDWLDPIDSDQVTVGVYVFPRGADFIISAFEAYLIQQHRPPLNKRRQ